MVRAAVGHVEPPDMQYQVESIKMEVFIWIAQPAFLPSSWEEAFSGTLAAVVVPDLPFSCLSANSTHFSVKLLRSQRSNSRPSFANRFSPQLSLHPHCTETGTFIPENP